MEEDDEQIDPDCDWMEARNERLVMIHSFADSAPMAASSYPMSIDAYEGDDENHHRQRPAIDSIISSREVICAQAAGGLGETSYEESTLQQ